MKKITVLTLSLLLFVLSASSVQAVTANNLKDQIKEKVASKAGALKSLVAARAKIIEGEIKSVGDKTLTVAKDGQEYTVNITDKTKLRRRFWGKAELTEFSVGDKVSVYGKWANEEKTAIDAVLVRNLSIQKRFGTFFGTITEIDGDILVIESQERGEQKTAVTNQTKIVNRKMQTMKASDLKVDDKVRIKGLWDRVNNTIIEVKQVKDFTQPAIAKASAKPSPESE